MQLENWPSKQNQINYYFISRREIRDVNVTKSPYVIVYVIVLHKHNSVIKNVYT